MKKLFVLLLTFLGLPAFVPPTRVEKRKEIQTTTSESERYFQKKKIKKSLLENLPSDLKNQILKLYPYDDGILNIPALAEGLTNLAVTSKTLHAGINNPQNMLAILKSLPRAGAQVLAKGLRKYASHEK